jgi:hypothetical protein
LRDPVPLFPFAWFTARGILLPPGRSHSRPGEASTSSRMPDLFGAGLLTPPQLPTGGLAGEHDCRGFETFGPPNGGVGRPAPNETKTRRKELGSGVSQDHLFISPASPRRERVPFAKPPGGKFETPPPPLLFVEEYQRRCSKLRRADPSLKSGSHAEPASEQVSVTPPGSAFLPSRAMIAEYQKQPQQREQHRGRRDRHVFYALVG